MSPVITVQNLGKKYILSHQSQERYTALRDVMANSIKRTAGKFVSAIGRGSGATHEQFQEEFWALQNVSFDVQQGDRIGIVGRNGAGKSTLLKILSRITEPTAGQIKIKGRVTSLLEVGTGFHPELTGRENIFLNGAILGMSKAEIKRKFDEIVAFAEVEKFLDTPVKRYSSGMYIRLAFAVAAHLESEILILDEVLAVGDMQFQEKCLGKMGEVSRDGRTVVLVSHNMGMISELCTTAVLLGKGNLIAAGPTSEIIDHYLGMTASQDSEGYVATGKELHEIYVESIKVVNQGGAATNTIPHNEPIALAVRCTINRWVSDSVIGFYVVDQRGRKVFTHNNEQWANVNPDGKPKSVDMTVTIPANFLAPGRYFVSFVISVPNVRVIDLAQDVLSFSVLDVGSAFAAFEGYDYGCVFASCEWTVNSIAAPDDKFNLISQ